MLFMVYDKNGVPFEVRPAKAKQLVIGNGWSMTKPKTVTKAEAAALAQAAKEAEQAASTAAAEIASHIATHTA